MSRHMADVSSASAQAAISVSFAYMADSTTNASPGLLLMAGAIPVLVCAFGSMHAAAKSLATKRTLKLPQRQHSCASRRLPGATRKEVRASMSNPYRRFLFHCYRDPESDNVPTATLRPLAEAGDIDGCPATGGTRCLPWHRPRAGITRPTRRLREVTRASMAQ